MPETAAGSTGDACTSGGTYRLDTKRALAAHLVYVHGDTRTVNMLVQHIRVEALVAQHEALHCEEACNHQHSGRYATT